jgi:hypothetical protein
MSIPSSRGSGSHCHLALAIQQAKYLALTGVESIVHANPGTTPKHPTASTTAQITESNHCFNAARTEFKLYTIIEGLLKWQILAAVDAMHLDDLNDETISFATSTFRTLLTNLQMQYGTIMPDQLEVNLRQLEHQWQLPAPLKSLFQQLKKYQCFAHDGNYRITDKTVVCAALKNIEATGLFTDACRDWRKKSEPDQTLSAFKTDFSAADKECQTTSDTAGYHGANAVCAVATPG